MQVSLRPLVKHFYGQSFVLIPQKSLPAALAPNPTRLLNLFWDHNLQISTAADQYDKRQTQEEVMWQAMCVCRPTQGSRAIQANMKPSFKASERRHTTKGKFLLLTAQEALQSLECEPTAAILNEAYADAAYFK